MNRKTIVILALIPVIFFATDKLVFGGGGKEKKKEGRTIEKPVVEQVVKDEEPLEMTAADEVKSEPVKEEKVVEKSSGEKDKVSREAFLLGEMKNLIAQNHSDEGMEGYYEAEKIYLYEDLVSDELRDFLRENLITRAEKMHVFGMEAEKSFSRCPTGYNVTIFADDNNELTNKGWLVRDNGCFSLPMGTFRYDLAANKVEMKISDKAGYVNVDQFLELYKKAKA